MHIVLDKKSHHVIFVDYSRSPSPRPPSEVYPAFDEGSMDLGWTDAPNLPPYFTIERGRIRELGLEEAIQAGQFELAPEQKLEGGKIVPKTLAELVKDGLAKLEDVKEGAIEHYSALAFGRRAELIPEYKLQNAALGVYEESVVAQYRDTVKAFRDEFYRIKGEIEKAKKVEDIERIQERFPKALGEAARVPDKPAPAQPPEPPPHKRRKEKRR